MLGKKKKVNEDVVSEQQALMLLETSMAEAKGTIGNNAKMEKLFLDLERKLEQVPVAGTKLAMIPAMANLVYSYWKKEYTEVPAGTILAILGTLIYFISPVDFIPDAIPVFGKVDDAAVAAFCLKMVQSDLDDYKKWRKEHKGNVGDGEWKRKNGIDLDEQG